MEYHESLLEQVESVTEYQLGEQAFLNVVNGIPVVIIAYIIYSTHIEYVVRSVEYGIMQLESTSLCKSPRVV